MNLRRLYNQNRKTILLGIVLFVLLLLVLRVIKEAGIKTQEEKQKSIEIARNEAMQDRYKENPDIKVTISDEKVESNKEMIIDQFIRYCNAGKINEAYGLLSEKCKKNVYQSVDIFQRNYVNVVFNTTKLYSKKVYVNDTYTINLYEDMASTGVVYENSIEDMFTIVRENGTPKLNISGYIGEKDLNLTASNKYLEAKILKREIYRDHEKYTIEFKNLTDKEILIDSLEDTRRTYLTDETDAHYYANLYENTKNDLTISARATKKVVIRFTKLYDKRSQIKNMTFADMILDSNAYQAENNKSKFNLRTHLIIEIY